MKASRCRFCKSSDVSVWADATTESRGFFVYCNQCEAMGPTSYLSKEEAIKKWNSGNAIFDFFLMWADVTRELLNSFLEAFHAK